MAENKFKITFVDKKQGGESGNSDKIEYGNPSGTAHGLDKELYETLGKVESLGRYDDFAMLKIDVKQYEKASEEQKYGILRDPKYHGTGEGAHVIRDNQSYAALTFLSKLRGFGLLADCVGSGKTYEAGVVISELAIRGLVDNLLVVVPDTALREKWQYVLEFQFGMGEGRLKVIDHTMGLDGEEKGRHIKPHGAYIMLQSEFEKMSVKDARTYLFDMIVVDEAHHLCVKKAGESNRSMYRLSHMMVTKREHERPYCLLLTATPHSGNLKNMFNLWYFISCKGGCPAFFLNEQERTRENATEEQTIRYEAEKLHYEKTVCKGATTITEYIDKATEWVIVGTEDFPNPDYTAEFLNGFTVTKEQDSGKKKVTHIKYSFKEYNERPWYEKKRRVDDFIEYYKSKSGKKKDIETDLQNKVREAYITEVMRAIMVRRKNDYTSARKAHSYFFLPTESKITPDTADNGSDFFFIDGVNVSHKSFFSVSGNAFSEKTGFKPGAHTFYGGLLNVERDDGAEADDFVHINQVPCNIKNAQEAVFNAKCEAFIKLVDGTDGAWRFDGSKNRRLIVFFDYDKEENVSIKEKSTWEKLYEYLERVGRYDICQRVIRQSKEKSLEAAIKKYNNDINAIFFAESSKCTEGQDMQSGQAILNFEVPIDPLTMDQRIGRVHRLGQDSDVKIFSFAAMNELDGYCLAYYVNIGILSDKNGDASILSGCNNDNMIAIQCKKCKRMEMLSRLEYDEYLARCNTCGKLMRVRHDGYTERFYCEDCNRWEDIPDDSPLRCAECKSSNSEAGVVREEITMYEYKCDLKPVHRLRRDNERGGYVCLEETGQAEVMNYSRDEDNRAVVECDKLCALRHCDSTFDFEGKTECLLKKAMKKGEPVQRNQAIYICLMECKLSDKDKCKCRPDKSAVSTCKTCKSAHCSPKPHRIVFDDKEESATCPICGKSGISIAKGGVLRKQERNTFESYIRNLYENDKYRFCDHFKKDAEVMRKIKNILAFD